MSKPEVWKYPDAEALSRGAAAFIRELANFSLRRQDRFSLVLSGGATPRRLYELLPISSTHSAIDWPRVHLFFGDERCAPPDHELSNYNLARQVLLERIAIPEQNVHRIKAEREAEAAARDYAQQIGRFFEQEPDTLPPPSFDLILLGLDKDGHTASLFPNPSLPEDSPQWVVPVLQPQAPPKVARVSFTPALINNAKVVAFLALGKDKAPVISNVFDAPWAGSSYPAALVRPKGRLIWFLDEDAASLL